MAVLRPARATSLDAEAFASLYQLATINVMSGYLGPHAYRILAQIFPLPHHEHSYDVTTFAVLGGVPVGLLMIHSGASHEAARRTLMLYARYGFVGLLRSLPTILKLRPLSTVTGLVPHDAYYIKGLAVAPDHRRKGIAGELMQAAESLVAREGCTRVLLDVRTINASAVAFYHSCGYKTIAETPSITHKGQVIGFLRMEKVID